MAAGWKTSVAMACVVMTACAAPPAPSFEVGQEVTVTGVVVENSIDPCILPQNDEPCVEDVGFRLLLDAGGYEVSFLYGSGLGDPCLNHEASEQAADTRVGTTVQVFAEVESVKVSRVVLSACNSADYHIVELD